MTPGIPRSTSTASGGANDTHQSTTDPEAMLHRKGQGKEAKLAYLGHVLLDNRHGLVANVCATHATGTTFDIQIDKDVVRRVLATHYRPEPDSNGPSWLTFLGHAKDSLWSIDSFRCESAILRSHWVLVVMDQYTRRIVGFGIQAGIVDGRALCCMFNHAIRGQLSPTYLSSDHDPLYRFDQWPANLRVLSVTEVKSVPYVPMSHPFVERLIGTLRRECRMLFWSAADLEQNWLNSKTSTIRIERIRLWKDGRQSRHGRMSPRSTATDGKRIAADLYQTPIAA